MRLLRNAYQTAAFFGLLALAAHTTGGQAAAEAGMLSSRSTTAAPSSMPSPPAMAPSAAPAKSAHLTARHGLPPDETNRRDFEGNAGEKAGKLLFRSAPSGAEIFINDLLVGRTPLLMTIAPGKYTVEMRGPRQESGRSLIGVLPKETQTVMIQLSPRYPARIQLH